MASPTHNAQVVIANRLRDGITVFLAEDNAWVEAIDDAAVARSAERGRELLAIGEVAAAANVVVGPYLIDVLDQLGRRTPVEWREVIRARGPTVETRSRA
jgi:hypothetical protein